VQPATELAVAGSVLQRLTYVGRADRRVQRSAYLIHPYAKRERPKNVLLAWNGPPTACRFFRSWGWRTQFWLSRELQ
jgi:hypothetical protein